MKRGVFLALAAAALAATVAIAQPKPAGGTIKGHVALSGPEPGNPIIRMGMDPKCAQVNAGKRVIQETVLASLDGSLANVFVRLEGSFPQTPVPSEPVVIDQRACIYRPRVVGARVGQTLQVKNSDDWLHNVHSLTAKGNAFNISEPKAGMVQSFKMKDEEMLRIKCDIHNWMTTYVGIVTNPYFSVSNEKGTFEIANVPPGSYTIEAWHEKYGPVKKPVTVRASGIAMVDFSYTEESSKVKGKSAK